MTLRLDVLALAASRKLKRFPLIFRVAREIYCVFRPGIRYQIEAAFRKAGAIYVVKIGANDGVENDPIGDLLINDSRYRGLLVEPLPHLVRRLEANYASLKRFKIERAAVGAASGEVRFFYVDLSGATSIHRAQAPAWLEGVASLDRSHVVRHLPENLQGCVKEVTVDCLTVSDLLKRNNVDRIDLLHIDAEGHDWTILQQFDFNRLRPKIVLFERKHLTATDQRSAADKMISAGYRVREAESDFICTLQ